MSKFSAGGPAPDTATDNPLAEGLREGSGLLAGLRLIRLLGALLYGILVASLAALLARLCGRPLALRTRLSQSFMKALTASLPLRAHIEGRLPQEPMLWVANHTSWTDIPLLGRLAPLSFLSKAEVAAWPLAGWLAKQGATLFIQRGAGQSDELASQIRQRLTEGHGVALFPEGTSGDGRNLLPFHGRLLSALTGTDFAVQPVAISYRHAGGPCPVAPFIGDDDLVHHIWRLFKHPACEAVVHLLPPIPNQGRNRSQLARLAKEAISEALGLEAAPKRLRQAAARAAD